MSENAAGLSVAITSGRVVIGLAVSASVWFSAINDDELVRQGT